MPVTLDRDQGNGHPLLVTERSFARSVQEWNRGFGSSCYWTHSVRHCWTAL